MTNIISLKPVNDILTFLGEDDFIAMAILNCSREEEIVAKKTRNMTLENKDEVVSAAIHLNQSRKKLIDIIKERYDDKGVIEKDNVIEYVSLYIVNNFNKLHFDGKKQDYYNRIDGIRKTLSNNFSVSMQMAIMLRAKMMVDKLYEKEEYETIDNFIEYLERSREVDDELLYIVYYGLYDGTINNFTFDSDEKEYNSEVFLDLLESDDHLPESIIVSLCKDKQFKKYDKSIVLLVMGWFFKAKILGNKNNDLTSLDVIQNLFSNDVTNFDSQAHFKDLSPIFKATLADLHITGLTPDLLNQLINNIISGEVELKEREDDKYYGSI